MTFISLYGDRNNRLGTHITSYLNRIFYAHKHQFHLRYSEETLNYSSSLFVILLLRFIEKYHLSFSPLSSIEEDTELDDECNVFNEKLDYAQMMYKTLVSIGTDFRSYWREIYPEIHLDLWKVAPPHYTENLPFDPKKTIAIHLRLDDVHNWWDYNGAFSAGYYRDMINRDADIQEMYHLHNYGFCPNVQAPIPYDRIQPQIDAAKERFPEHEIVIISSPSTRDLIGLPYRVICNEDESYDLFLLSIADVVILSRSHFSISAILFGNHSHIYVPLWGQFVAYGFSTKYDRGNDAGLFSYFW